jgi:hypothetical protein
MSRAREIASWEICTRAGGRDDAMDLQAIGTSKKCIFEPDKIEPSRRTSAAELIADFEYMDVSDAGIANSKDKE